MTAMNGEFSPEKLESYIRSVAGGKVTNPAIREVLEKHFVAHENVRPA